MFYFFHTLIRGVRKNVEISHFLQPFLAKADRWLPEEKKFYHQFYIVKYSYLPIDTFRKYVSVVAGVSSQKIQKNLPKRDLLFL